MKARAPQQGRRAVNLSTDSRTALLASIIDSSDDAIMAKTPKGVITSWNRGAEIIYGYRAEEIIGRPVSVLTHPSRPDEMDEILQKIRAGQRVEHYETLRMRKDGKAISVSLTVSPILDAQGRLVGVSSIARDITERKRADENLRAASEYARSLIEASLDPLVTISPEGKITDVNEATIKVTGVSLDKLIGTDFSDYFTEPEKAREGYQQVFANSLKHAFPAGRSGTVRVSLREPEDQRFEMVVADDGVGLPRDLDPRRTHSLGLDLVWTFAEQIDADVDVVRTEGTAFWFRFPRDEGAS